MKNQVSEKDKDDRLQKLQKVLYQQQKDFNQSKIGKKLTVLLEKHGKYDGQLVGKSEYMQSVIVENSQLKIGDIVDIMITNATQNSLHGEIINNII